MMKNYILSAFLLAIAAGCASADPAKEKGEPMSIIALPERRGSTTIREFVKLLLLFTEFPGGDVKRAVRQCVSRRAFSQEAVRATLAYSARREWPRLDLADSPELAAVSCAVRPAGVYDALLSAEEAQP